MGKRNVKSRCLYLNRAVENIDDDGEFRKYFLFPNTVQLCRHRFAQVWGKEVAWRDTE